MPFKKVQVRACFARAHNEGKSDQACHKMARESTWYKGEHPIRETKRKAKRKTKRKRRMRRTSKRR